MSQSHRVLVVDDNPQIHEDYLKLLCPVSKPNTTKADNLETELFGEVVSPVTSSKITYQVDSAFQGKQALEMVEKAELEQQPYALIFMDCRMPPGWDGIKTSIKIWQAFPFVEIVLVTAYSDYTWDEILAKVGETDQLLFLKKPFDGYAVKQIALAQVTKWNRLASIRDLTYDANHDAKRRLKQIQNILHIAQDASTE